MRRPRILILITIVAILVLISGATIYVYRQFVPTGGTDLPDVPTFEFNTSTPVTASAETSPAENLTPVSGPTAGSSFFVWPSYAQLLCHRLLDVADRAFNH